MPLVGLWIYGYTFLSVSSTLWSMHASLVRPVHMDIDMDIDKWLEILGLEAE